MAHPQEVLDRLNEFPSLRGFQDPEMTPTSAVTSLPTPNEVHASFRLTNVDFNIVPLDTPEPFSYPFSPLIFEPKIIEPPCAPLLKDLDTFTEGTAAGSFDSIPAAPTDEFGHLISSVSHSSLSQLPLRDKEDFIELWRAEVHVSLFTPCLADSECSSPLSAAVSSTTCEAVSLSCAPKRPRSLSDDDEGIPRARVRTSSPPPPPLHLMQHFAIVDYDMIPRPHSAPPG